MKISNITTYSACVVAYTLQCHALPIETVDTSLQLVPRGEMVTPRTIVDAPTLPTNLVDADDDVSLIRRSPGIRTWWKAQQAGRAAKEQVRLEHQESFRNYDRFIKFQRDQIENTSNKTVREHHGKLMKSLEKSRDDLKEKVEAAGKAAREKVYEETNVANFYKKDRETQDYIKDLKNQDDWIRKRDVAFEKRDNGDGGKNNEEVKRY